MQNFRQIEINIVLRFKTQHQSENSKTTEMKKQSNNEQNIYYCSALII